MRSKNRTSSVTPFDLFRSIRGGLHPFILDSGLAHDRLGRWSFVGVNPFLTFTSKGSTIRVRQEGRADRLIEGDPFEVLRGLLNQHQMAPAVGNPPFIGGAVGYFGYDLCHFIEKLPSAAKDDIGMPDCFLGFYDAVYAFDNQTGVVTMTALDRAGEGRTRIDAMAARLDSLEGTSPQALAPFHNRRPVSFHPNMTRAAYMAAMDRIKGYIHSGDIYQVNLTQRFDCPFVGDPVSLYGTLRAINPAPFSAYIDTGEGYIVSSSPERFLRLREGVIETRPIKGTIQRGRTPEADEAMKAALLGSEKDRAELLMIVDLERNDLSRIAKVGTVRVPELFALETYPTLHHLVATVRAEVRPECDRIDCIKATFPGGSITGAPKIRAMEIIDELEPTRRGVYTGSIGYLGFDGSMDLNIAIRTVVVKDDRAYLQAGGGITWDSESEGEYEESLVKAKALMEALSLGDL